MMFDLLLGAADNGKRVYFNFNFKISHLFTLEAKGNLSLYKMCSMYQI